MFTGLRTSLHRGIVEKENRKKNDRYDGHLPTWRDRYPKVDLEGRHFWDLHPLCSENSLTFHGAEYVFVGVADVSGSLTLDADSAFFAAICGGGSECTNATSVVLNWTLPRTGEECGCGVPHVKVGSVIYRYNRLPCVDQTQERKQTFLEIARCWPTCSVIKTWPYTWPRGSFLVLSLQTLRQRRSTGHVG